jgi:tetratricopeptide (TPR) repeat protein
MSGAGPHQTSPAAGRKGRFALPNAYLTVTPEERALRSLLNQYRAGEFDQAIARLATTDAQLRQDALATTLDRLGEAIAAHNPQRPKTAAARDAQLFARYRADRVHVLMLAVLIETDAVLHVDDLSTAETQLSTARTAAHQLLGLRDDFRERGAVKRLRDAKPFEENTDLVYTDGTIDWPDVQSFVRLWYLTVISRLQGLAALDLTNQWVNEGLERFKGERELLLARGATVEADLIARVVDQSLTERIYGARVVADVRKRLEQARDDLENAAAGMPAGGEAILRLGHIRLLLGDLAGAGMSFAAVAEGGSPTLRYLASLFDGARAEAAKNVEGAKAAYDRALQLAPDAQSAMLAVSHLEDVRGDAAAARKWVVRSIDAPANRVDPWGSYWFGQADLQTAWLTALRAMVVR